jgi:beta-glucosidase
MERFMTPRTLLLAAALLVAAGAAPATQPAAPTAQKPLSAWDSQANALIATMSLDEKVGQMTQADQMFLADISDIETLFLGSLLSGGDSDPPTNTVEDWADMYDRYQQRTQKTRLRIPLLYGVDAVHGHSNVIGAVIFPHNIGLGATRNAKPRRGDRPDHGARGAGDRHQLDVRAERRRAPRRALGADVRGLQRAAGAGRGARRSVGAGTAGYQPRRPAARARLREALRGRWRHHLDDRHAGARPAGRPLPPRSRRHAHERGKSCARLHMQGYVTALRAGVGTIMPSYSSWNGEKASGSHRLLTEILKQELRFEGFLISDYNAIDELPGDYRSDVKTSVLAGMDMFMVPERYREFITTLKSLVEAGEVPMSRIDDAVRRILRVKFAMGLMNPEARLLADRTLLESFGSAAHRAVGRQAVRESLVVLKNDGKQLPLARTLGRIHVAGRGADDIGMQSGGWTITWQGRHGMTTPGTTVLMALQQLAGPKQQVTHSVDGSGAKGADVGVVVVGESPYAEFFGDSRDLSLSPEDVRAIRTVKEAGVPVVVVLLSGRPMILGDILDQADAIVAAWLPGTEGLGVGDVLFGDYKPTGKLPFSWPRSMEQIPINVGDAKYDPLYPFGHGLSY